MRKVAFFAAVLMLIPFALAQFRASVSFEPSSWSYGKIQRIAVSVQNSVESKENLVKVEIYLPFEANKSVYEVEDDFTLPPKWKYFLSYKGGKIYKITFESEEGIKPGEKTTFWMNSVKAPQKIGEFEWKWKVFSEKEKSYEGTVKTKTTYGKLSKFELKNVPEKIRAGEKFAIVVIAYDEFGNVKEDYAGKVRITSTDRKAKFPSYYSFKPEYRGRGAIKITYGTPGEQYFTITDEEAKVSIISPKTLVLPAVPINLRIQINKGALYTSKETVMLSLSAENAEECRYSNDGVFWSEWENYSQQREWRLIPGEGTRIVYYQCRNKDGESEVVYDSIELVAPLAPFLPAVPPKFIPAIIKEGIQKKVAGVAIVTSGYREVGNIEREMDCSVFGVQRLAFGVEESKYQKIAGLSGIRKS